VIYSVAMILFKTFVSILLLASEYRNFILLNNSSLCSHVLATSGNMGIYFAKSKDTRDLLISVFIFLLFIRSVLFKQKIVGRAKLFISSRIVISLCVIHSITSTKNTTTGLTYSSIL